MGNLEIGGQLRVGELSLPAGVATTLEADVLVAQVVLPRVVAEPVDEEAVDGEAVDGEPATGEAPASGSADATDDGGSGADEG